MRTQTDSRVIATGDEIYSENLQVAVGSRLPFRLLGLHVA